MVSGLSVADFFTVGLYYYTVTLATGSQRGGWGEWSKMTHCSVTCGNGFQRRVRTWIYTDDEEKLDVPFTNTEEIYCYPDICPQNGLWGMWGRWSECSSPCNGGERNRTRLCNHPPPLDNGLDCSGRGVSWEDCNTLPCPKTPVNFNKSICLKRDIYFNCTNHKMCVRKSLQCDYVPHCSDGSDEVGCYRGSKLIHSSACRFLTPVSWTTDFLTISALLFMSS